MSACTLIILVTELRVVFAFLPLDPHAPLTPQVSAGHGAVGRFKIVVPENIGRLPPTLSLSSCLLYSPRCLAKIRRLCGVRPSYIVPGRIGPEDLAVSQALKLPLFAPSPALCRTLSTKSGAHRVFEDANVPTAPSACSHCTLHDVFSNATACHCAPVTVDALKGVIGFPCE